MTRILLPIAGLLVLASGCVQHSKAWDDAWAACQSEAQESLETAEVNDDQRSTYLFETSNACMERKGFKESDSIFN
jgi:hypothetical protein